MQRTIGALAERGYCVADYARLDAVAYGVPQHRLRSFWFGHRGGSCIRWPEPTHGGNGKQPAILGCELLPVVTCRAALSHLPPEDRGHPGYLRSEAQDRRPSDEDRPGKTSTRNGQGEIAALAPDRTPVSHASAISDWAWDRPATTVVAGPRALSPLGSHCRPGNAQRGPNAIVLSERAATILQGFPESWQFRGATGASRWSQIGQAMPPPLAEAVARRIVVQMTTT